MLVSQTEALRLAQCLAEPWAGYARSLGTVADDEDQEDRDRAAAARALLRLRMALLDLYEAVSDWEDDDS